MSFLWNFNFSTEKNISQKFSLKKNNNQTTKTNFPEFSTSLCHGYTHLSTRVEGMGGVYSEMRPSSDYREISRPLAYALVAFRWRLAVEADEGSLASLLKENLASCKFKGMREEKRVTKETTTLGVVARCPLRRRCYNALFC